MTAPTITRPANGSAYPPALAELMPAARDLAAEHGDIPSRNALMRTLKVGATKANQIREALDAERTAYQRRTQVALASRNPGLSASALLSDETVPAWLRPDPLPKVSTRVDIEPADVTVNLDPADTRVSAESDTTKTDRAPAADKPPTVAVNEPAAPGSDPILAAPVTVPAESAAKVDTAPSPLAALVADPGTKVADTPRKPLAVWPVWVLALPAIVAIWSGWVGLGELAGFGMVRPLPGIADGFEFNSAITLPIGMEVYAAYALRVWLSGSVPAVARRFAKVSALGSLALGALGQVAYHLMNASGMTAAPWWITTLVACLPVAVLGMGATLAHLLRNHEGQ